jgi:3-oxoacyl-[acyl-carrier protein] reductase/bacilysin biosynthesis oxidoreductase BacG
MNLGLREKIVLVTGASAGIGRAAAEIFAQEECILFICGRNKEKIEKTYDELKSKYSRSFIYTMSADMNLASNGNDFINRAIRIYGRIDVLINNIDGPVLSTNVPENISDKEWTEVFSGKLHTYIRMINLVLPHMKKQKYGRIVNVIGSTGKEPSVALLAAGVTNAGLINYIKAIAHVVGKHNILINAINPGCIHTARLEKYVDNISRARDISMQDIKHEIIQKVPLQRLGKPQEVANLIAFLASERASYINGVSINVDGGLSASAF